LKILLIQVMMWYLCCSYRAEMIPYEIMRPVEELDQNIGTDLVNAAYVVVCAGPNHLFSLPDYRQLLDSDRVGTLHSVACIDEDDVEVGDIQKQPPLLLPIYGTLQQQHDDVVVQPLVVCDEDASGDIKNLDGEGGEEDAVVVLLMLLLLVVLMAILQLEMILEPMFRFQLLLP
jgi:hypothetical protein